MSSLLGVDVGGTFTDFVFVRDAVLTEYKRASTPGDPARGVLQGLREAGFAPDEVVHGSTVATNAVLERRGARTALITTGGFRDALVIGRQARRRLYSLEPERPAPLVPAEGRFDVRERVGADGEDVEPLDRNSLDEAVRAVEAWGAESVAVCLLFSFLRPEHEQAVAAALRARGLHVSTSVEVLPEYREYERMSTTVMNAYVAPVMTGYLGRLEPALKERGVERLRVLQSDGGSLVAETAGRLAVRTVLSGPAGGVVGAFAAGTAAGNRDLITLDMGGTSTDVALCPGRLLYRTDLDVDGLPVSTPAPTSTRSARAAARSLSWTRVARCGSGLRARAPIRARPATAGA
jgi:N-methylhydantoinase A